MGGEEINQFYVVGLDPDLLHSFHSGNTCWHFLRSGVVDFHCGDPSLLSGGTTLFPEQMLVVLIVSVLCCRFVYYLVHAFIHYIYHSRFPINSF